MTRRQLAMLAAAALVAACGQSGPEAIDTTADACSRCRMSIDRVAHAGEMLRADGRVLKYDSLGCLALDHHDEQQAGRLVRGVWVNEYGTTGWLEAPAAWFALANLKTDHMGYGIAATRSRDDALRLTGGAEDRVVRWDALYTSVVALENQRHE